MNKITLVICLVLGYTTTVFAFNKVCNKTNTKEIYDCLELQNAMIGNTSVVTVISNKIVNRQTEEAESNGFENAFNAADTSNVVDNITVK